MTETLGTMDAPITYRLATRADAHATYAVFQAADAHNRHKTGRPAAAETGGLSARGLAFRHSSIENDGDRFWVAEIGGTIVGYVIAVLRDDVWYLASLHVLPAYQARKIGSELIRRSLAGTGPDTVRTVLTDATNPASTGLYLRHGMLPQDSTLTFAGASDEPGNPPEGADRIDSRPIVLSADLPILAGFDMATVGFRRPVDHAFWTAVPELHGRILEREGRAIGYAYVGADGGIGPMALATPDDLYPALDLAARLAANLGATGLYLRVPGSAREAARWASRRGLRLSGIGLVLASTPIGTLDGYVTSAADSLY